MNWRTKLQEKRGAIVQDGAVDRLTKLTKPKSRQSDPLTKLTKPSFDGSVSEPLEHFGNAGATAPSQALNAERARLLELAIAESVEVAYIQQWNDGEIAWCIGLDEGQHRALLHMLEDTAERQAGRVPAGDTSAVHCARCGPVWLHPDVAAVLPVADGWPRALGCPWCFIRASGGYVPSAKSAK